MESKPATQRQLHLVQTSTEELGSDRVTGLPVDASSGPRSAA